MIILPAVERQFEHKWLFRLFVSPRAITMLIAGTEYPVGATLGRISVGRD